MKQPPIVIPEGCHEVLLHACCAPCSSAIVEWLTAHDVRPTIFYFNPNIWPREEYNIRKLESKRHAESLGLSWIDGDYDHQAWLKDVSRCEDYDVAHEPERGRRCDACFTLRLTETARKAAQQGFTYFTTTLASSRWKSLQQVEHAGLIAQQRVPGTIFWAQNWRKGGLQERRNELLKAYGFYNQQYCGCEFSAKQAMALTKPLLRQQMRIERQQHEQLLPKWSEAITARLKERLRDSRVVAAFWPLADEVDVRSLVAWLVAEGKTVLLPRVTGDTTMELRRYESSGDLREGAFHILEPTGALFADYPSIDIMLVPGVAFDAAGRRLGRGRGYYDRFLSLMPQVHKLGVCFPYQRVAEVPAEAHDIVMDEVVSEV